MNRPNRNDYFDIDKFNIGDYEQDLEKYIDLLECNRKEIELSIIDRYLIGMLIKAICDKNIRSDDAILLNNYAVIGRKKLKEEIERLKENE